MLAAINRGKRFRSINVKNEAKNSINDYVSIYAEQPTKVRTMKRKINKTDSNCKIRTATSV